MTADPSQFAVFHASDEEIYEQVEELLKTKVVGFDKSRLPDDGLFPLAQALGANGAAVTRAIQEAGQIVFHAVGDSGATSQSAFRDELRVSDHASEDLPSATVESVRRSSTA